MIVVYDTIKPIPNSVISRVLNILKSENLSVKFTSDLKDLNCRTEILILTSYRPKDILALILSCPNHLIFVQHGMQTSHSLKRDIASLISGAFGHFVRTKDAIVFNSKARLPYGICKRNVKRVIFSDRNAKTISFQANAKEVLLIDQPLYTNRLSKDYEMLSKRHKVLVKWHPRSRKCLGVKEWAGEPVSCVYGYSSSLLWGLSEVPVYTLLEKHEMPATLRSYFKYTSYQMSVGYEFVKSMETKSTEELESVLLKMLR